MGATQICGTATKEQMEEFKLESGMDVISFPNLPDDFGKANKQLQKNENCRKQPPNINLFTVEPDKMTEGEDLQKMIGHIIYIGEKSSGAERAALGNRCFTKEFATGVIHSSQIVKLRKSGAKELQINILYPFKGQNGTVVTMGAPQLIKFCIFYFCMLVFCFM